MSSASIASGSDVGRGLAHQVVVPEVAAFLQFLLERTVPPLHDDDVLDRRRVGERFVGDALQLHDVAAPVAAVGGDEEARLLVVDAIAQRLGAEAAEDDAVDGADARAGEHRDRELGDQRQVDRDAVAFLDAERSQHVRELADLAVQLPVGQRALVAGLAFPDDGGLVPAPRADVAVEAVDARRSACRRRTTSRAAASSRAPSSQGVLHSSSPANFAQKPSGSLSACS